MSGSRISPSMLTAAGAKAATPAGLNLGDCVSYALAKSLDAPLLFKGADFPKTDVRAAL
jgi:ribonuclease VapC